MEKQPQLTDAQVELVREEFKAYVARQEQPHGEISRFAKEFDLHRATLSEFKNDGDVPKRVVKKIADALARKMELTAMPVVLGAHDPALQIADEIQTIVNMLRSPAFDSEAKLTRLFKKLEAVLDDRELIGKLFRDFARRTNKT